MASPILHIKDAYYFDVPKFLAAYHYASFDEVPKSLKFLVDRHSDLTIGDFNREMSGKILIPQPFGTLKNLYEKEDGFCISKFMVVESLVAILLTIVLVYVASKIRSGGVPRGKLINLIEAMLLFIRDQVARPAIGASHDDSHGHDDGHGHGHDTGRGHDAGHAHGPDYREADKFVPLLWTIFFFILTCNLFGLIPWAGSPTGSFSVTLALAGVTLLTVVLAGMRKFGLLGFFFNQVPSMDLPWYMAPIKLLIFVIEIAGLLIRHGVLAVRLLANMVAGHVVLLGIMGVAFTVEAAVSMSTGSWTIAAVIAVIGSMLFSLLELFVAFLQAYIFTFLSALFIGSALHRH